MKALKSDLCERISRAGLRLPLDGTPFQFDGKWYAARRVPTARIECNAFGLCGWLCEVTYFVVPVLATFALWCWL